MADGLTPTRRRVLEKLTSEPRLIVGTELTAAAWLFKHGYAMRHRLNHFSVTAAGIEIAKQPAAPSASRQDEDGSDA